MPNPTLSYKSGQVFEINNDTKKLFKVIYEEQNKKEGGDEKSRIRVSALVSKMAFYYEKIRNAVDNKDDHLWRKNAILRILKRQIIIEGAIQEVQAQEISKHLLSELIRGGYLLNNTIEESKIRELSKVIDKYIKLRKYGLASAPKNDYVVKNKISRWVIAMAASDIEGKLERDKVGERVISNMYKILSSKIELVDAPDNEKDKDIQIYTGIHRYLLKFDDDLVGFLFFKYYNADWEFADDKEIKKKGENIMPLIEAVQKQINNPLANQLSRIIRRYAVFFTILTDVIKDDPAKVYASLKNDPKAFPRDIKKVCGRMYGQVRTRLWRAIIRSIIYIILTKVVLALVFEIPAVVFFGGEANTALIMSKVVVSTGLLFLVALFTRLPSDANTDRIIKGINEIVLRSAGEIETIQLSKPVQRGKFLNFIFNVLYAVAFFTSFGFTIWVMIKIGFDFVSISVFLFILAFVSFLAVRIKRNAQELIVVELKENFLGLIVDFFYTPIAATGKWLSDKFERFNLFVLFLDFIIEAPFKVFVEITEEWTKYVRERKDEIA